VAHGYMGTLLELCARRRQEPDLQQPVVHLWQLRGRWGRRPAQTAVLCCGGTADGGARQNFPAMLRGGGRRPCSNWARGGVMSRMASTQSSISGSCAIGPSSTMLPSRSRVGGMGTRATTTRFSERAATISVRPSSGETRFPGTDRAEMPCTCRPRDAQCSSPSSRKPSPDASRLGTAQERYLRRQGWHPPIIERLDRAVRPHVHEPAGARQDSGRLSLPFEARDRAEESAFEQGGLCRCCSRQIHDSPPIVGHRCGGESLAVLDSSRQLFSTNPAFLFVALKL